MTTSDALATTPKEPTRFRLPDIPEKRPDDMTTSKHLAQNGNMYHLLQHLGAAGTIIVSGDRYICHEPGSEIRYPDLLVAFDAVPALYELNNGYIVSEQGKPPDLVLEFASRRTGAVDTGVKRGYYEALGIPEYWRFDETGEFHGARLSGDLLVDGEYVAAEIEALPDGSLQGYSGALDLYLRWVDGELAFYDPATGEPIATLASERARADMERDGRLQERQARQAAEARVRELEERLRRHGA